MSSKKLLQKLHRREVRALREKQKYEKEKKDSAKEEKGL